MPILPSGYTKPPFYLFHPHLETIVPSIWRKVPEIYYRRERIDTPDGDFLDLDWAELLGSPACVVISHGLEGSTDRHYVKGLVKAFHLRGISALAWNNRSCGEEMNRGPILYHHGASYDLDTVVTHLLRTRKYEKIYLVGVSMGGAQTLKYLGEKGAQLSPKIKAAAVHSTPCNLADSAATLQKKANAVYKNKFLSKLKKKVRLKAAQFPSLIDLGPLDKVRDFDAFDTLYTAKLHGFRNAQDFYAQVSADQFMPAIEVPTLVLNAANDPLLEKGCYPFALAQKKPELHLEVPARGGHTGFTLGQQSLAYSEIRLAEFVSHF